MRALVLFVGAVALSGCKAETAAQPLQELRFSNLLKLETLFRSNIRLDLSEVGHPPVLVSIVWPRRILSVDTGPLRLRRAIYADSEHSKSVGKGQVALLLAGNLREPTGTAPLKITDSDGTHTMQIQLQNVSFEHPFYAGGYGKTATKRKSRQDEKGSVQLYRGTAPTLAGFSLSRTVSFAECRTYPDGVGECFEIRATEAAKRPSVGSR